MALPTIGKYNDIAVEVELDPTGAPGVYSTICGATSSEFAISNEIVATKVADCADLNAAIQTLKTYGAQNVTISIDASWTVEAHQDLYLWAKDQKSLNTRLRYPNAASGKISTIEGLALLATKTLSGIGNLDGNPQAESLSLEISGGLTDTLAP